MAGLQSTKVSDLDAAETIGPNDFLYMVRNTIEAGLESKKLPVELLLSMLGGGGDGGVDPVIHHDYTPLSLSDLTMAVNGLIGTEAPTVTTCNIWTLIDAYVNTIVLRIPTSTGQYILVAGPGTLGQVTNGLLLAYLSPTAGLEVLSMISVPDALGTSVGGDAFTDVIGGSMNDATAHGSSGDVKWWKATVEINDGPTMKQPFVASLVGLPAKADGTLVPYNLSAVYAESRTSIVLVLTIYEPYDKFINQISGTDINSVTPSYNLVYWY